MLEKQQSEFMSQKESWCDKDKSVQSQGKVIIVSFNFAIQI